MKCPKCGRENVAGAPFCADCGKNLFSAAVSAESQRIDAPEPASAPKPEPAPQQSEPEVVATPIITDGAIHIAPVPEKEPEPEPIPTPEPAFTLHEAFDAPAGSDVQLIAETVTDEAIAQPAEDTSEVVVVAEAAEETTEVAESESAAEPEATPEATATPEAPAIKPAAPATEEAPETETEAASETEAAPEPAAIPEPTVTPEPETKTAPEAEATPEPEPQFAPFATTPIVPPNPARAHQTYPQPGGEALYKKGCLAAAWDDIMQTKGWFGKILLLGLISCVPILNFFALGYAMRWSRELFLGKVAPMPERIFGSRMFANGFFAFVLELVIGIIVGICGIILEFIPFVGVIAYLALTILVTAFEYLALLRVAVADRLGAGFDVGQIWNTGKRNFGALCCATIVPTLIIGAIVTVIVLAVMLIMGIPLIGSVIDYANSVSLHYYSDAQVFGWVMNTLAIILPMIIVCYLIGCFIGAFQTVLIMRATGHYVARYAPEWKNEQAVMSTAHINGI